MKISARNIKATQYIVVQVGFLIIITVQTFNPVKFNFMLQNYFFKCNGKQGLVEPHWSSLWRRQLLYKILIDHIGFFLYFVCFLWIKRDVSLFHIYYLLLKYSNLWSQYFVGFGKIYYYKLHQLVKIIQVKAKIAIINLTKKLKIIGKLEHLPLILLILDMHNIGIYFRILLFLGES